MRRITSISLVFSTLFLISISWGQQPASTAVPNLIRYSGTLKDAQGAALPSSTAVGVTFSIYKQQDGGTAVWMETQNVTPDSNGQYSVVLGSTTATGLPDDLFSQQEQRWLGVQVQGEAEQARVMLVSVPYAFKAHEAETLGGLPASAFVKVPTADVADGTSVNALSTTGNAGSTSKSKGTTTSAKLPCLTLTGGGTTDVIARWGVTGCDLINSIMTQVIPPSGIRIDVAGSINLTNQFKNAYQIGNTNVLSVRNLTTLVGNGAGFDYSLKTANGNYNTFVGGNADRNITTGNYNTIMGTAAGVRNTTGSYNTFSGYEAGNGNLTSGFNTYVGSKAGLRATGEGNTFVGEQAGLNNTADNNVFYGRLSGFDNTTGSNNTFLGAEAGNSNIGGSANTFSGREAGFNNIASDGSFYGYRAGYNNDANGNSFYGREAGFSNTTARGGAFFGYQAGYKTMNDDFATFFGAPSGNSFFGYQAGFNNTTGFSSGQAGTFNTFAGYQAGYSSTIDVGDTFLGYKAGYFTDTNPFPNHVSANTFAGSFAGYANITGTGNAYFGYQAGEFSQGDSNSFFGVDAGANFIDGFGNTFIGAGAGSSATTGNFNLFVGAGAGYSSGGSNNIYLANDPGGTESNTIRIGGTQTDTYIAGIFGVALGAGNQEVCINATGHLGTVGCTAPLSSRRFKEQVANMGDSSSKLFQLRPVTFFYKPQYDDGSHSLQYGLIAEEVAKVYPELAVYDKDGQPYSVKYQLLAPMLLNELQKQHTIVAAQQDVIKTQQKQVDAQQHQIESLQKQNVEFQQRLSRLETLVRAQVKITEDAAPSTRTQ